VRAPEQTLSTGLLQRGQVRLPAAAAGRHLLAEPHTAPPARGGTPDGGGRTQML